MFFFSLLKLHMSTDSEREKCFGAVSPRLPVKGHFESDGVLKMKYLIGLILKYMSHLTDPCRYTNLHARAYVV